LIGMALLANLAVLKLIGGLVLVIVCFAFGIVNGRAAAEYSSHIEDFYEYANSADHRVVLYQCALALAVLGILATVVLLGAVVIALLELPLPSIVVLGLFGGGAVLFLACLIAAAVGVSSCFVPSYDAWYRQLDSRNYNESDDIRDYVNGYEAFVDSGAPSGKAFLANGTRHGQAEAAEPKQSCFASFWDTNALTFRYAYSYYPLTEPMYVRPAPTPGSLPFVPGSLLEGFVNAPTGAVTWRLFLADRPGPVCYGVEFDSASVQQAATNYDVCVLKSDKALGCAPGWSVSSYLDLLCDLYTECLEKKEKEKESETKVLEDLDDLGAIRRSFSFTEPSYGYPPSEPNVKTYPNAWVFPRGWEEVSAVKSYLKSQLAEQLASGFAFSPETFYSYNLTLLCVGVVGWVLLIAGIVVGFLGGGDAGGENDKP
jgi:hypothetical protein